MGNYAVFGTERRRKNGSGLILLSLLAVIMLLAGCASKGKPAETNAPESGAAAVTSVVGHGAGTASSDSSGESGPGKAETVETTEGTVPYASGNGIFTAERTPVKLRYDRMWMYSDYAETEDPELIGAVVEAVKALEVGAPSQMSVEDYTDILTFTFEDGTEFRLEFEENMWVAGEREHYEVDGLKRLRSILDVMIEEKETEKQ